MTGREVHVGQGARWRTLIACALLVGTGALAYSNSFAGCFILDDNSFTNNENIVAPGSIWDILTTRPTSRPLVNLTFAANYAAGGYELWGYHLVNLLVHILAGLVLYGVVRRTLSGRTLGGRFAEHASWLALAVALLWLVHPLQTASVTYLVQRSEVMMGLFYLLTLHAAIRSFDSPRRKLWYAAAVVCCGLGMLCKQVMVTAPLIVPLYDRTFAAGTFRAALRRRWGLYAGLAATWSLLFPSVPLLYGVESAGFGAEFIHWWEYAMTEPAVILHYLWLTIWPAGLCFDYAWGVADQVGEFLPQVIVVAVLIGLSVWALRRAPAAGFAGVWTFLLLAPTSSILPIADLAFEHRMYLSLAGIVALVVCGGYAGGRALWQRLGPPGPNRGPLGRLLAAVILAGVAVALGGRTYRRNQDYHSHIGMWAKTAAQRPGNFRAQNNYAALLMREGRLDEADEHYRAALRANPLYAISHRGLAQVLEKQGRLDEAAEHYQQAARIDPRDALAWAGLAETLYRAGKMNETIAACREALNLRANTAEVEYTLAKALSRTGSFPEAVEHYRRAIRGGLVHPQVLYNLGLALARMGRDDEAIEVYRQVLQLQPDHAGARRGLGIALSEAGHPEQAIENLTEALRLEPDHFGAHYNLGLVLMDQGQYAESVRHLRDCLQIRPDFLPARNALAWALATSPAETVRDGPEAVRQARRICHAKDNASPEYLATLAAAQAETGRFQEAVATVRRAISLAEQRDEKNLAAALAQHLELYGDEKPLRGGSPYSPAQRRCEGGLYDIESGRGG